VGKTHAPSIPGKFPDVVINHHARSARAPLLPKARCVELLPGALSSGGPSPDLPARARCIEMALQVGQLVKFKDNGDCWGTVFGARRAMPRRDAAVLLLLLLLLGIHDALR